MSSYNDAARVLAPKYFVLVDENDEERGPSGLLRSPMLALGAGGVQPVFTSSETARDFAEAYYAEGDPARPRVGQVDALVLAGLCDGAGFEAFVFDPAATSAGRWTAPQGTVSVGYYRRFAAELSSGLEELVDRAEAVLGLDPEDLQTPKRVREWCEERVGEAVEDAHARAAEFEERESPRPGS